LSTRPDSMLSSPPEQSPKARTGVVLFLSLIYKYLS
jgi:hypothetical protein